MRVLLFFFGTGSMLGCLLSVSDCLERCLRGLRHVGCQLGRFNQLINVFLIFRGKAASPCLLRDYHTSMFCAENVSLCTDFKLQAFTRLSAL